MSYTYVCSAKQMAEVNRWLKGRKVIVFDIETGPAPHLVSLWEKEPKIALDPRKAQIATMQVGDEDTQWIIDNRVGLDISKILEALEDNTVTKIGVNLKFDCKMMMHHYGILPTQLACCMIMEQVLRCGMFPGKQDDPSGTASRVALKFTSMKALAERYLDVDIDKDKALRMNLWKTDPKGFDDRQLAYMAGDCVFPHKIAKLQKPLIMERGLQKVVALENRLIPVIANMELVGIPFDKIHWAKLLQDQLVVHDGIIAKLDKYLKKDSFSQEDLFGEAKRITTVEYSSPQKLAKALTRAGYPGFVDRQGKSLSVASGKLKLMKIEKEMPDELVDALLDYKRIGKRISSYGTNFIKNTDPETNRIYPDFTQTILVTGRMSCSPGMQTIPQEDLYRAAFNSPDGWVLIVLDASQIEARISADTTKDWPAIDVFQAGGDIYKEDGEAFYNTTIDKSTPEGKRLRNRAKVSWLGLSYGQGKDKFHDYCRVFLGEDIPKHDTDFLYDKFFEIHWRMKEVMDQWSDLVDPLKSTRYVVDPVADRFINKAVAQERLTDLLSRYPRGAGQVEKKVERLLSQTDQCRYAETLLGRKRFFRADYIGWWTAGRNMPVQGCAADVQKCTMLAYQEMHWREKFDAHIINVVHDEIITLVKEDQAEELFERQVALGEKVGQQFLEDVPMKVDGGITKVWKKF